MSKMVFKAIEVGNLGKSVKIQKPQTVQVNRVDDEKEQLRRLREEQDMVKEENKDFIEKTQEESDTIIQLAREEADRIVKEAEDEAFKFMQTAVDKSKIKESEIMSRRESEIRKKKEEAEQYALKIKNEANDVKNDSRREGQKSGYEEGYRDGKTEADRLVARLKVMVEAAIDKREEIIQSAEDQIVRIILLMARKVVKHITDKDERIVIENIRHALQKIQGKEQVMIKVNPKDIELTTEHKEDFIKMVEGLKYIKVLEDSRVDRGGCILETDFGSIDARITTQLEDMEDKIRDMANMTMFDAVTNKTEEEPETAEKSEKEKNIQEAEKDA